MWSYPASITKGHKCSAPIGTEWRDHLCSNVSVVVNTPESYTLLDQQTVTTPETATLRPETPFVTRPAPGIGTNPGGGIEVVVPTSGVRLESFHYSPNILGQ